MNDCDFSFDESDNSVSDIDSISNDRDNFIYRFSYFTIGNYFEYDDFAVLEDLPPYSSRRDFLRSLLLERLDDNDDENWESLLYDLHFIIHESK